MTLHPETQEIIRKLARTPEGCIALARLVLDELREIDRHISGAATRCEVAKILREAREE